MPGSYSAEFTSKIHFNSRGIESWKSVSEVGKDAESYTATLVGGETKGDFDKCSALTDSLLHLDSNSWCDFAHAIFAQAGRGTRVAPIATSDYPTPAARPLNSRLDCRLTEEIFGISRPDWREALTETMTDLGVRA